jgi:transposase
MMRPMTFRMPTDEAIHTAFEKGEAAVRELFHHVADQMAALARQLAKQGEALQDFQARLATNSGTSSQPPASDGEGTVQRTARLRQSGDKPNGGQPGHEGQTLSAADPPDRPETHEADPWAHCQASWTASASVGDAERHGFDLPAVRIDVTAHRAEIKVCPAGGHAKKGSCPASVRQAVPYGPMVHPWASSLTTQHPMPVERTTEIGADVVQHRVSEGTVWKASEPLDRGIEPSTAAVQGLWRDAEGLHVDASGLRVTGTLPGRHGASTDRRTSYAVHAQRGHEAMEDAGLLGAGTGTAVHDHGKPSGTDDACAQALCTAHHLRELRCLDTPYQQSWATDMAERLLAIQAAGHATPEPAMRWAPPEREALEKRDDEVVQSGCEATPAPVSPPEGEGRQRGRPQQPPAVHVLIRLRDFKGAVLAFMADLRVPFDHNQGERDMRMVKVTPKVSGGCRTLEGAKRFGRIRGDISTARQQAKNVFEALRDAFDGHPFIPSSERP